MARRSRGSVAVPVVVSGRIDWPSGGRHIEVGPRSCGRVLDLGTRRRPQRSTAMSESYVYDVGCNSSTGTSRAEDHQNEEQPTKKPKPTSPKKNHRTFPKHHVVSLHAVPPVRQPKSTCSTRPAADQYHLAKRSNTSPSYRANKICGGGGLFAVRPFGHSKIRLAWSRSQRIVSRCPCT